MKLFLWMIAIVILMGCAGDDQEYIIKDLSPVHQEMFVVAMGWWNDHLGTNFRTREVESWWSENRGIITIGDADSIAKYGWAGNARGIYRRKYNSELGWESHKIFFNFLYDWKSDLEFCGVARHELGHHIGFDHNQDDPTDPMAAPSPPCDE